jgi:spore coat polysaccharide biosynthesis protein SpsF
VLKPLLDKPMLARQIERLKRCRNLDRLIVATSTERSDDAVVEVAQQEGAPVFRGSLEDVLDRFYQAAKAHGSSHVVRLTADCPLTDPTLIDDVVQLAIEHNCDFASNDFVRSYPRGLDVEVMTISTLETLWHDTSNHQDREHVTPLVYAHPERFKIGSVEIEIDLSALRWTVDYQTDFDFVTRVYQALYPANPEFGMDDILRHLILNGEVRIFDRTGPDGC